jgi:hypothetical protein
MIKMNNYRRENGSVDWDAYHGAQVIAGEICMQCGHYIFNFFGPDTPGPKKCGSCETLDIAIEEVTHEDLLRCPKCKHLQPSCDEWESGIHNEDDLSNIICNECEHEYEVETSITYSFRSPPLLEIKEKD